MQNKNLFIFAILVIGVGWWVMQPKKTRNYAPVPLALNQVTYPRGATAADQQYIKNSEAFAEQLEKNPPEVTVKYPGPQGEAVNLEKHNSKRKILAREALLSELNNHETVELSSEEMEIAVEMMRSEGFKSRFEN